MCLLCVFFLIIPLNVGHVYAFENETLEFFHNERIFTYNLYSHIKTSTQFDLNHEINKYNRFGSTEERIFLLKRMLNIGIKNEVALEYLFPNISKTLNRIEKNIHISAKNATIFTNPNTEKVFSINKEVIGIDLDRETLVNEIINQYLNKKELNFKVPIQKTKPEQIADNLKKHTYLLSDFSTNISTSSADRKHNIKNALNSLNKIEVAPNQVFSFNNIVGRRTAENGYRTAKIIVNNEFVDGVGGGVCQVSSTLYNSALLAGLEIVEANKHSKQVSYVKAGFDAMVNFGSSDLKFKNNTNEKITIITNYSTNTARIRIFGANPNKTSYKLINEIFNEETPSEQIIFDENQEHLDKVIYEDEYFYFKKPNKGLEIKTYREKYQNNSLISKELLRHDKYKVQNAVKIYGTKPRSSNQQQKSTELSVLNF